MRRPRSSYLPYLIVALSLLALGAGLSRAQDDGGSAGSATTCEATLESLWALVSDACATGPVGFICNGGSSPQVRPEGNVANSIAAVGSMVETGIVEAVQTLPIITEVTGGGVMWFRWGDPLYTTGLIVGEAVLFDMSADDRPAWTSIVVQTGVDRPDCSTTPHNTFILEAQSNIRSQIIVNGVSLDLTGVIAVRTLGTDTYFIALSGKNTVTVQGQEFQLWTGQQITIRYPQGNFTQPEALVTNTSPLDPQLIENLPTGLLDQPVWIPQPGYVTTEGLINLRASPSLSGDLIGQVPAGEMLAVLGANPERDWYHVSLSNGISGWMFAELLNQNMVQVSITYDATPVPPQRFGTLNTIARVRAPSGLNVRENPSTGFGITQILPNEAQVTMIARSPYSPWVKVADDRGNILGWVAVVALDTRANVNALPIDNDVPPPPVPPPPTPIPGTFGNAFPDPNSPSF